MITIEEKRITVENIIGVSTELWTNAEVEDEFFKLMEDPDNI